MPADSPSEVWSQTLATLKLQTTRATFDARLARTWVVEAPSTDGAPTSGGDDGNEWVIGVSNPYSLDWLTHRLAPTVARTLSWTVGAPATVRFVLATEDPPPHPSPNLPTGSSEQAAGGRSARGEGDDCEVAPALEAACEEPASMGEGKPLVWTDFYIKLKVAFRKRALRKLKGARLSVFLCLSLHVDRDGIARPGGIETIMHETAYSRGAVCSALEYLESAGLIRKLRRHRGADEYEVLGYAWFGEQPAPALWESKSEK